jgi:hypothetical protein
MALEEENAEWPMDCTGASPMGENPSPWLDSGSCPAATPESSLSSREPVILCCGFGLLFFCFFGCYDFALLPYELCSRSFVSLPSGPLFILRRIRRKRGWMRRRRRRKRVTMTWAWPVDGSPSIPISFPALHEFFSSLPLP